jgi:hypothetical protein
LDLAQNGKDFEPRMDTDKHGLFYAPKAQLLVSIRVHPWFKGLFGFGSAGLGMKTL